MSSCLLGPANPGGGRCGTKPRAHQLPDMQQRVHRRETSSSMVPPRRMGPPEMHTSLEDQTVGHRLCVPEVRMVHQSYVTGGGPHARSRNEKKQRRQNEKAERRRRKDLRNKKWEMRASLKGRATVTEIWAWNIQRARVAFPKRNRFCEVLKTIGKSAAEVAMLTEMKETETGMEWIKSQDLYGVLVHGKKSGVLLRDDWAVKWKEQGCKRYCGERCTSVEVDGTVFIAVYQPLWNSDKVEFAEYREELNGLILKCKQQTKLIIGGDLNSSVGNDTKREDEVADPFGLGPTNLAGEDLINWCHEQSLSTLSLTTNGEALGNAQQGARGMS